MKQFLKEQWKRVTAVILALTLIASGLQIGMVSNAAGETELKITGVVGFAHTNAWDMKLGTSAALPGNGAAWSTYYHGPDVIIAGQNYDIGLQKQGATQVGIYIGSDDVTIPVADGTVITIRAGIYEGTDGSAIKITEDYSIEFDSSLGSQGWDQWKPHVEATEMTIAGVAGFAQTNAWDMKLSTSVNLPGTGAAWSTYFHGPDVIVGGTSFDIGLQKTGANQVGVYLTSEQVTIPVADGTTITIKAGTYEGTDGSSIKITEDYSVEFDSSLGSQGWDQWKPHVEATEMTIAGVAGFAQTNAWDMKLSTSVNLPGTGAAWSTYFHGPDVIVGGTSFDIGLQKTGVNQVGVYLTSEQVTIPVADGTAITIKAGTYEGTDGSAIKITEDYSIEFDSSLGSQGWDQWKPHVEATEMTIAGVAGFAQTNAWDMKLSTSVNLPGTGAAWSTYFHGPDVIVGGTSFDIGLQKTGANQVGVYLTSEQVTIPVADGTVITIKAGTYEGTDGSAIKITEDYSIEFDSSLGNSGWDQWKPHEEIQYDDVTIKALNVKDFNTESVRWNVYVDVTGTIPGTAWEGQFSGLKYKINDQEYSVEAAFKHDEDTIFFYIPESILPKDFTGNKTIVVETGYGLHSAAGTNGIHLTEDFTIYANEYGWSTDGFFVPPSYKDITFTGLNPSTGYNNQSEMWFLYIEPSKTLPGTADSTFFTGLQMSVDGGAAQDIRVTKASHGNTAFIFDETGMIPKEITKNTKIVIHAGKALSNDGSDGIQLTKDCVIYANQYGLSLTGYPEAVKIIQSDAKLSLDRETAFGGNENGLYLNTNDKFSVDTTWRTRIKAIGYDENSGVFLNGEKIDAPLIRFADGKLYVGLADAGVAAKDKDKLTVKGTFALESTGVTYQEVTFYFNGKTWNTQYEPAKPETYKQFAVTSVNNVTGWNEEFSRWNVYLNVNALLPGEIDKIHFDTLIVEVNGQQIETSVYHSYQDTLFFPIEGTVLPKNVKDGTKITIKAGKALATDKATGIELTKDFTFYTFKGSMSDRQPTTNTTWQDVTINGMLATGSFNKDAKAWAFHLKLRQPLTTESGTVYLQLPLTINGKEHLVNVLQDGEYLYISIPESVLSANAKTATITIKEGAKAWANAGYDGIRITDTWTTYLFNGAISEKEFTEVETTETRVVGLQNVTPYSDGYHVYLRLNKEFPGTAWYEKYDDFVYYYNGLMITTSARKSESSNNKFMYFPIETAKVGTPKEGDIITIKEGTVMTCGGYEVKITNSFMLMYSDGIWSQYMETDVAAPEDNASLWSVARFEEGYIPLAKDGSVLYSNEDKYNKISSMEPMKDFTISFNAKKFYDDETSPSFGVILRGNAVSDTEEMTKELLYGYVITFSSFEWKEDPASDEEGVWTGYLNLWKNGENYSLIDQYRISYVHDQSDHPFFQYEEDYNYEFSIYNITETCVCITAKVNGKLVMRYYDEAGSDPFDPAVNAGTFQVFAGCPNYITDDIVELSEIISEKEECTVGDNVRVAATYPAVIEGADFSVDKDGATIKDGVFTATKPGTYTISGTYNGNELTSKTITVVEAETETNTESGSFPIIPVAIAAVVIVAGVAAALVLKGKGKKKQQLENEQ